MKKLIILLFVLASIISEAQIEIPLSNRTAKTVIKDTIVVVKIFPENTGQTDEFLFLDRTFPSFVSENGFVTMADVDTAWNDRFLNIDLEKSASVSDTVWNWDRSKYFGLLENRYGFVLCMKGQQVSEVKKEKTTIEKLHWLYWFSIQNSYSIGTYVNYPQVIDLLKEYNSIGVPETPQDTITP